MYPNVVKHHLVYISHDRPALEWLNQGLNLKFPVRIQMLSHLAN